MVRFQNLVVVQCENYFSDRTVEVLNSSPKNIDGNWAAESEVIGRDLVVP